MLFSKKQSEYLRNDFYDSICADMNNPDNDVTEEYEYECSADLLPMKDMDKMFYLFYCMQTHPRGDTRLFVIKNIVECQESFIPLAYCVNIIDMIDVDKDVTHNAKQAMDTLVGTIAHESNIITNLAKIIGEYAREPICIVSLKSDSYELFRSPVYSFPFTGIPKDPIMRGSILFSRVTLEFSGNIVKKYYMHMRGCMLKISNHTISSYYLPGYDAISMNNVIHPRKKINWNFLDNLPRDD